MLNTVRTTLEVLIAAGTVFAAVWAIIRIIHIYREKFLFFSGCHLIPISLKEELQQCNPRLRRHLENHAFNPLIVLPRKFRNYLRVKDGSRVILRFKQPGADELMVTAKAFWYPEDHNLWDLFEQPAVSLVLRRYFGIEKPLMGESDITPAGWYRVEHGTTRKGRQELAILHRTSEKNGNLIWLVSENYSTRFWLPEKNAQGVKYKSDWADGWFLEYSGISLKVTKPSIISVKG
ncbi:MAG: hypothetical protein ACE5NG_02880 [bacterium]